MAWGSTTCGFTRRVGALGAGVGVPTWSKLLGKWVLPGGLVTPITLQLCREMTSYLASVMNHEQGLRSEDQMESDMEVGLVTNLWIK